MICGGDTATPNSPDPIGRDDGGGDRLHDAGDLVDLGEHDDADLIERRAPRVEQQVPLADRRRRRAWTPGFAASAARTSAMDPDAIRT